MSELTAIVIMGHGGVIGDGADQPWHIAEDQQRFKRLTTGGVLIMGRRTFEAIGRVLPGRTTVVLTRDPEWRHDQVTVAHDADAALAAARSAGGPIFVAGGGEIYRLFADRLTRLEVTLVDAEAEGDVTFPVIDTDTWYESARENRDGYSFVTWERLDRAG
ncbi:dihydrofolate reductase [Naumannella huperziae]